MKARLKTMENEAKEKDLMVEKMQNEINTLAGCAVAVTTLENEMKVKDETIEALLDYLELMYLNMILPRRFLELKCWKKKLQRKQIENSFLKVLDNWGGSEQIVSWALGLAVWLNLGNLGAGKTWV